jgi:hypothetical protein
MLVSLSLWLAPFQCAAPVGLQDRFPDDSDQNHCRQPAALALGRRGGAKKVPKGFSKMTAADRRKWGAEGAKKRWG